MKLQISTEVSLNGKVIKTGWRVFCDADFRCAGWKNDLCRDPNTGRVTSVRSQIDTFQQLYKQHPGSTIRVRARRVEDGRVADRLNDLIGSGSRNGWLFVRR